jgi:hypothetical protein
MALKMGNLYDALKSAGVEDSKAQKAAEEVASFERDLADVKATQRLHSWMLGLIIALLITVLWRLFA